MKKFFQTEWQGIPFASFTEPSETEIAGAEFYEAFYSEFFRRYSGYSSLDERWRATKEGVAALIASRLSADAKRVLSIGCGIGMVEHVLLNGVPDIRLDVIETTKIPLRWLEAELCPAQIHIGLFPRCLPTETRFDFVYLSGIDYCFNASEWVGLLGDVKSRIQLGGRCLVICASVDRGSRTIRAIRSWGRGLVVAAGLRKRGQLWGYLRTVHELRDAMTSAGFSVLACGDMEDGSYWLEGGVA